MEYAQIGVLGEKPFVVKLDLNEWFRFEKPGIYTLSVRSRRVSDDAKATATMPSVVPVESNTVSFEILPRDLDWEATELSAALQILDSKRSDRDRQNGCRMLRFLGTDAAVDEMIKRYDEEQWGCDFEYTAGLFSAPDRDRVVRQLEAGLRATDQPVSEVYLRTLALLSVYVQHPELRPPQTRDTKGRMIPSSELGRLQDLVQAAKATYAEILDAALPEKSARARAMILSWRVNPAGARTRYPPHRRQRRAIVCVNNSLRRSSSCRPNGRPRCSSISGPVSPARPWCPSFVRSSRPRPWRPHLCRILR